MSKYDIEKIFNRVGLGEGTLKFHKIKNNINLLSEIKNLNEQHRVAFYQYINERLITDQEEFGEFIERLIERSEIDGKKYDGYLGTKEKIEMAKKTGINIDLDNFMQWFDKIITKPLKKDYNTKMINS